MSQKHSIALTVVLSVKTDDFGFIHHNRPENYARDLLQSFLNNAKDVSGYVNLPHLFHFPIFCKNLTKPLERRPATKNIA